MKVVRTIAEVRAALADAESSVGFVPTMGALHEGHLSLIREAAANDDTTVLSIFVNPSQFGPAEDFGAYPRSEERDLDLARDAGVDIAFVPDVDEIYPAGDATRIAAGPIALTLEGEDRPGHFDGVCTVVAKLFNIVGPTRAYFGQKDAQQLAVVKQMVRDLAFDVEIVGCPTVRESDGLAMSSRNAFLSPAEREQATALYAALTLAASRLPSDDLEDIEKQMWASLMADDVHPGYARIVDPERFTPAGAGGPWLLVVAARVGTTRLIDNLLVER